MINFVSESEEDDSPEQITVKFARTETERSKAAREKSFGFLQKKNAEESWIQTPFYQFKSEESQVFNFSFTVYSLVSIFNPLFSMKVGIVLFVIIYLILD